MNTRTTFTTLAALVAASVLALAGCASSTPPAAEPQVESSAITVADAWVKSADDGMSAAFGVLANGLSTDVTLVSAETKASSIVELHETVENDSGAMVMRPVDGGFVIPAGGTATLEPGANHIMLIDLTAPLKAGETVTFTLVFSDGSSLEFSAPVKDYSGANETYESGTEMDMGH